jgi:hypothetical protein
VAIATALAGVLLAASPGAAAATEVGNDCEANATEVGSTILPLATSSESSLPIGVPTAGVATKWMVRSIPGTDIHTERLKVLRPTADPLRFQVVGESDLEDTTGGLSSFDIGIPVQPGDRFGVSGKPGEGAIACPPRPGDVEGILAGDPPLGSTPSFAESEASQAAVSAIVEPDSDGDGYGDETQDGCPQSAAYHGECPVVALGARASVYRRSIVLSVSASLQAPVFVYGQVGWGFKPKPKGGARISAKHHLIVGLRGGTKTAEPGRPARFRINLPRPVRRRLGGIAPRESLKAKLTVSAPNIAGPDSVRKMTVRLRGRKRSRGGR